jgi:RNA polymerase sigma factor (sigma-70 family)
MMPDRAGRSMLEWGVRAQMPIADHIEELFSRAEPRLLRIARAQQVAPDAVEDIVQETLLEAWRSLDHLRDETRFAAWLDGICRNVCRRHLRRQGIAQAREAVLGSLDSEEDALDYLADPDAFDPAEELARQDMALLLDRALGYLSPESRAVVEQHYLAEIPQRELAARMGLTLAALEARLHRARSQILHALSHDLRAEAIALGLALDPAEAAGWRETRIWCIFCGRQRMLGIFDPMSDGRINLRLRCPVCEMSEINSLGMVDLSNARSFLPAIKKLMNEAGRFFSGSIEAGGAFQCPVCQRPNRMRIVRDEGFCTLAGMRTRLESDCTCMSTFCSAITLYGHLPTVREFLLSADRAVIEPEVVIHFAGQQAIRFSMVSLLDRRRVHVFADAATLASLDVVLE